MSSGGGRQIIQKKRLVVATAMIVTGILAFLPSFYLSYVQIFLLSTEQYQQFLFVILAEHFYLLAAPGFLGTIVVVVTVIDVIRRRQEIASIKRLVILLVIFHVATSIWYWVVQLRCMFHK